MFCDVCRYLFHLWAMKTCKQAKWHVLLIEVLKSLIVGRPAPTLLRDFLCDSGNTLHLVCYRPWFLTPSVRPCVTTTSFLYPLNLDHDLPLTTPPALHHTPSFPPTTNMFLLLFVALVFTSVIEVQLGVKADGVFQVSMIQPPLSSGISGFCIEPVCAKGKGLFLQQLRNNYCCRDYPCKYNTTEWSLSNNKHFLSFCGPHL